MKEEELFYTEQFADEHGVNRAITHLAGDGEIARAEYFHTDKFAGEQGYDKSIASFDDDGTLIKNEYFKDGRPVETK
jgi:hypothetical protein